VKSEELGMKIFYHIHFLKTLLLFLGSFCVSQDGHGELKARNL